MANAIRGTVYDYDFGPIVDTELSGPRRALIISKNDVNDHLQVAISLPTSSNPPHPRYYDNHVEIEDSGSWAAVRQIKTIDIAHLGTVRGSATSAELDRTLEILTNRLFNTPMSHRQTKPTEPEDTPTRGSIWYATFESPTNHEKEPAKQVPVLIMDHNTGNNIAIVAEVRFGPRTPTPVRVPVSVIDHNNEPSPGSVLIHHIRSIATSTRLTQQIGIVHPTALDTINEAFFALLDPQRAWPPSE